MADWYIATNGIDTTSSGTRSNPCATVQYILDNKVAPGDTIKVMSGIYTYNINWFTSSFWADISNPSNQNNITITADDPNNKPLIQGVEANWGLVWIRNNVSGITISNLRLAHSNAPIYVWKDGVIQLKSNPTLIDNCEIYNGANGVGIETNKNVEIRNCDIHHNGKPPTSCSPPSADAHGGAVYIYNFENLPPASDWSEKIYIHHNILHDNGEHGSIPVNTFYRYLEYGYNDIYNNGEYGLIFKDQQYVRIHHNKIHHNCGGGIGTNFSYPSHHFEIWNNEFYENNGPGIFVQGDNENYYKCWNNLIYNNCRSSEWTIVGAQINNGIGNEFHHNVVYNNNNDTVQTHSLIGSGMISNNIFYNNGIGAGGGTNGGGGDHNYVYPATGDIGTNAITTPNHGMTDPTNNIFTLLPNSPLIDAGVDAGIYEDFRGIIRPQGMGYDIGAYEYVSDECPTPVCIFIMNYI